MDTRHARLLIALLVCAVAPLPAEAETTYFVVGVPNLYQVGLGDSYILPLSEPADILQARQLVNSGGGSLIVNAWVTKGSDGINRNWVAEGHPFWSWHVSEFWGFPQITIELCDGTPTFTEAEASRWADGGGTQICYWGYRVLEEVVVASSAHASWSRVKALY